MTAGRRCAPSLRAPLAQGGARAMRRFQSCVGGIPAPQASDARRW
ncbi:hypothetical protein NH44784_052821 [Achromobacter xylosoxidans NH44784-1996]|nr:hypothetical protein NH44784_052821 [Achromobacter xylosoxidans NH44784-1996]